MGVATVDVVSSEVEEMTVTEGREMLRQQVSDRLGLDLDDFLARVERGDYDDTEDDAVLRLVMLAPFAS